MRQQIMREGRLVNSDRVSLTEKQVRRLADDEESYQRG